MSASLAQAGALVAAAGLGLLLAGRGRALRLTGLSAWAAGLALFVPLLAPAGQRALLAVAAAAALPLAAGLAVVFRRWPWLFAGVALAAVPARVPVTVGDTSAKLLLPLYALVAGAALALGWSLWRDPPRSRELGPLTWPLVGLLAWFSLSALWAAEVEDAAVSLFFFFLPFTVLALAFARLPWRSAALRGLYGLLGGLALLFAAVGVYQWLARDIFWNEKVMASNAFRDFRRVNSVFWDPSMYGRFLVVAIVASLLVLVFRSAPRWDVAVGVGVVALWVGLLFSFSQSSFLALLVGLTVVVVLAWRRRSALAAVGLAAVVAVSAGVAAPGDLKGSVLGQVSGDALERVTSGRFDLVVTGLEIAADHPLEGVGVGGFEAAYRNRLEEDERAPTAASHTTPITVVAETGAVGLALFAWLVAAAFVAAFRGWRTWETSADRSALVLGACLAAVFTHSLFYSAFFEDPTTWGLLALIALAAAVRARPAGEGPSEG